MGYARESVTLAEFHQVPGALLEFCALLVEIAHALIGFGVKVLAALRDKGVEIDLRVLPFPEAAGIVEVGKFVGNLLADLCFTVERPLLNPALDFPVHLVGQSLTGSELVPLAASLTFRSHPMGGEPSVSVEADIFALRPVEPWNVFPLGARGCFPHRSGHSSLPRMLNRDAWISPTIELADSFASEDSARS